MHQNVAAMKRRRSKGYELKTKKEKVTVTANNLAG